MENNKIKKVKKISKIEEIRISTSDMLNIYGGISEQIKFYISSCSTYGDCKYTCAPTWYYACL